MIRPNLLALALGLPFLISGCAEWSGSAQTSASTTADTVRRAAGTAPSANLLERERNVVETNNVLAVLQAQRGQYRDAEQLLLASITLAPRTAYLYNNLGYVYLLTGQYERAKATFEQAARMNPEDAHVRANLAKVSERMVKIAETASKPPPDVAPALPTLAAKADTLTIVTPAAGTLVIARVAPNVYEIRDPSRPTPLRSTPPPVAKASPPQDIRRLDVVNGNGVAGMAKRVAIQLHASTDLPMARLFNRTPYDQRTTLIQYRDGLLAAAIRLQGELPGPSNVSPLNTQAPAAADIRIFLGRDAVSWPVAWSGSTTPHQASAIPAASKQVTFAPIPARRLQSG